MNVFVGKFYEHIMEQGQRFQKRPLKNLHCEYVRKTTYELGSGSGTATCLVKVHSKLEYFASQKPSCSNTRCDL